MEFDHLFICCDTGAPEADRLAALGFTEGAGNSHPGQGTACRRFFFENAYLELLWVENEQEARALSVEPLRLWDRWQGRNGRASPFGVALRPSNSPSGVDEKASFPSFGYRPQYLPPGLQIDVSETAALVAEPLVFFMTFATRPDAYAAERAQPLVHDVGVRAVTRVTVTGSIAADWLGDDSATCVRVRQGDGHVADVGFDDERCGKVRDCRPWLPLIVRW